MVMNQPFTTTNRLLASYSFSELISNFGIVEFYPAYSDSLVAGDEPYLATKTNRSTKKNAQKKNDETITFDSSPFTTPQTILGTATLTFSMAINRVYAGTASGNWNFELIRLRGAVETSIGTASGDQITTVSAGAWASFTESLTRMPLTETNFAIGDVLRLVLTATTRTAGSYDDIRIYTDPENETADGIETIFKVGVPFKVGN
jgi:hypothetical protein